MTGATRRVSASVAVALVTLLLLATAADAQDTRFLVRDSEFLTDGSTQLTLAVTDPLEQPLTADQVAITENGEPVEGLEVASIGSTDQSEIGIALIIDTSGSTEGEPATAAREAAKGFLQGVADVNPSVVLVAFNDEAQVAAPPTSDLDSVSAAIDGLVAEGETALYDAVVLGAEQLAEVDGQRRLVLFSDGADTTSQASLEEAVEASLSAEAPITTVVLNSPDLDTASLEGLATSSEGSTITVDSAAELSGAFEDVATELANQYVVTYEGTAFETSEIDVSITVDLPGAPATQSFTVPNDRVAAPVAVEPPPSANEPGLLGGSLALVVGLLAAFGALVALVMLLVLTPRSQAARLLDRELTKYVEGRGRADSSAVAEALRRRASGMLERSSSGAEFQNKLQKYLDQGAVPLKAVELLAIMIVGGLLLGMIGLLAVGVRGFFVFAPVGVIAPYLFVIVKRSRRLARFLELLPDTLQLIAGSLSAGYGVLQAIDMVTKESEDPMSTEFNRVLVEARLGVPLEESLETMADRMDSDDFRWVVLAMNIQREVGGNLAALMHTVAQTLRDREALRRHIKALSAEGKLSAIILVALPFFLAGYLILVNPTYVGTLVESLIGWVMIVGGIIGLIVGTLWIRNLIRAIEV